MKNNNNNKRKGVEEDDDDDDDDDDNDDEDEAAEEEEDENEVEENGDDGDDDDDGDACVARGKKTARLISQLLSHWGTNVCKIERLNRKRKHAEAAGTSNPNPNPNPTAVSKTSMITVQNVQAMLTEQETERNANVEQWWKKVKKLIISSLKKLGSNDCAGINALVSLLNGIHPPVFIDKPSTHSQRPLSDALRCIALCADKTRCPKQRNRNHSYLCTMHTCHNPFGIDPQYIDEVREKKITVPVQLRLVLYRGINYYVDTVNNNVYNTDDIFNNSPTPRIIGTYASHTTDNGEETYTIPELDAFSTLSNLT